MRYENFEALGDLLSKKLITKRKHPTEDLWVYNYTASAQALKIDEWPSALCDCRGLILDKPGEVVGRPFSKFWNYEQVLDKIPGDLPFTVWEKLDGSLGIVCNYRGKRIVATRGSFESEQAIWAGKWLEEQLPGWMPLEGLTYLAEIIYPENRIVVDYGDVHAMKLLAVMEADGRDSLAMFHAEKWDKARGFPPTTILKHGAELAFLETPGDEGYVVRWANGFRAKVKFAEYVRLHKLITQVSTRTIWELLRAKKSLEELIDKVPQDFKAWVVEQEEKLRHDFRNIAITAADEHAEIPPCSTRKEFAACATKKQFPHLVFAIQDQKPIRDLIFRMIEPKWATPFRRGVEE